MQMGPTYLGVDDFFWHTVRRRCLNKQLDFALIIQCGEKVRRFVNSMTDYRLKK